MPTRLLLMIFVMALAARSADAQRLPLPWYQDAHGPLEDLPKRIVNHSQPELAIEELVELLDSDERYAKGQEARWHALRGLVRCRSEPGPLIVNRPRQVELLLECVTEPQGELFVQESVRLEVIQVFRLIPDQYESSVERVLMELLRDPDSRIVGVAIGQMYARGGAPEHWFDELERFVLLPEDNLPPAFEKPIGLVGWSHEQAREAKKRAYVRQLACSLYAMSAPQERFYDLLDRLDDDEAMIRAYALFSSIVFGDSFWGAERNVQSEWLDRLARVVVHPDAREAIRDRGLVSLIKIMQEGDADLRAKALSLLEAIDDAHPGIPDTGQLLEWYKNDLQTRKRLRAG